MVTGQATGIERKNLANAVATVSADELLRAPTATVEQSLQGKIAGAEISQNSGAPGGGLLVRLRGVSSIIGAYTPLYVVDGVIVSDVAIPPGTNFVSQAFPGVGLTTTQENQVNRIADLNPNDVENVEVLKGASASAIYGSKASNGVILITTKRDRIGAPQFSVTQRFGVSEVSHNIGNRTFTTLADAIDAFGAKAANDWAAGKVFDHEREIDGSRPLSHETDASVSGGTETGRYFASALVKRDAGIITNTFYDKQSLRFNLDQSVGRRLTFTVNSEAVHSYGDRGLLNNENNGSSMWSAFSTTPSFFDLRATCPDSSRQVACAEGVYPVNPYGFSNPDQTVQLFQNRETVWRIIGAGKLTFDVVNTPTHTLRLLANGGGDFFNQRNNVYSPPELQFEPLDGLLGTSAVSFSQNLNSNLNTNAVYTYKAGKTTATTSLGFQFETRDLTVDRTLAANLVGGLNQISAGTKVIVESNRQRVEDVGYFAQEELLTLGEHLLLTAGLRADKSSNNGDAKHLFVYPKAAVSYRISPRQGPVSELKLRAALGASGNQPLWGQKFTELKAGNIVGVPTQGLQPVTGAQDLRPERQREMEGGIDATLLGGRASLEVTGYEKRINDLLLQRSLAPSFGFTTQIFNGGVMRTRGLELGLTVLPVQTSSFRWSAHTSAALSRCKILAMPVPTFRTGFGADFVDVGAIQIEVGKSCTQLVGYDSLPDGSRYVRQLGDANPDYHLSFSSDLSYRRLTLYFLWDHQRGGRMWNATYWLFDIPKNSVDYAVPRSPGELTGAQRVAAFPRQTLLYLQSTTYVKLREVRLSYELPPSLLRSLWSGVRSARLSVSGRNLLRFTPYRGMDPEWSQQPGSLASQLQWEIWMYPPSRSFWFSVDLGL